MYIRKYIIYFRFVLKQSLHFSFQAMENKIRSTLNEIYFGKTKDIVNGLR